MEEFVYKKLLEHEKEDWWNKSLRNIVSSYINTFAKVSQGRLIDIGFGAGFFVEELSSKWETFGIDPSKTAVAIAKKKGLKNIYLASAEKIPFADDFFDVILVLDVLEHIKDEVPSLKEIRRVLKPGGIVIFNSPAYKFLWSYHDETAKHFRRYTTGELARRLDEGGLVVLRLTYINFFLFPIALVYRLIARIKKKRDRKTDVGAVPKFLQPLFFKIFSSEAHLLKFINLPFGLSVSAVATKGLPKNPK